MVEKYSANNQGGARIYSRLKYLEDLLVIGWATFRIKCSWNGNKNYIYYMLKNGVLANFYSHSLI